MKNEKEMNKKKEKEKIEITKERAKRKVWKNKGIFF